MTTHHPNPLKQSALLGRRWPLGRMSPSCSHCKEIGHTRQFCSKRLAEQEGKPRRAWFGCSLCCRMAHRVSGARCRECGLAYAPERLEFDPVKGLGEWGWAR